MTSCCADYCTNSAKKGFRMCRIPRGERRKLWLERINRDDLGLENCDNMRLCHAHFSPDMWEKYPNGEFRCLKSNAVPTIFRNLSAMTATDVSETFLEAEGTSHLGCEMDSKMNEVNDATDTTDNSQGSVLNSGNKNTLSKPMTYSTLERCNCTTSQNLGKLLRRSEQLRANMKRKLASMKKDLKRLKREVL
ncbi:uncharacterized protein [Linepithema humile]|uniref:uncharacterized protein n=2 Tax=Linepithema humile TaxID=83485 RepID=UPI00351EBC76